MRDELTDAVIDLYRKITENSFQIDGEITLAELNSLLRGMGIKEMGRCNQDVRDAVLIALTCSGLPMRMR